MKVIHAIILFPSPKENGMKVWVIGIDQNFHTHVALPIS